MYLAALHRHIDPATQRTAGPPAAAVPAPAARADAGPEPGLAQHPSLRFARPDPPLLWGPTAWAAMASRQRAEPLLDTAKVRALVGDRKSFLRDGVLVLPAVMHAPSRWTESLRQLQELNDEMVTSDWGSWIDWAALGVEPPLQSGLTAEQQQRAVRAPTPLHTLTHAPPGRMP